MEFVFGCIENHEVSQSKQLYLDDKQEKIKKATVKDIENLQSPWQNRVSKHIVETEVLEDETERSVWMILYDFEADGDWWIMDQLDQTEDLCEDEVFELNSLNSFRTETWESYSKDKKINLFHFQ